MLNVVTTVSGISINAVARHAKVTRGGHVEPFKTKMK